LQKKQAEFVIYIINEIANKKHKMSSQIYKVLQKTNCIKEYLVPMYDVLHTLSSETVVNDVCEFVKNRGENL